MHIGSIRHPAYPPLAGSFLNQAANTSGSPIVAPAETGAGVEAGASAASQSGVPIDFTRATRQELFDWMNGEIRAGRMTLHESTSFLAMTLKIDPATNKAVDMATDTQRYDFTQRLRDDIEGAYWRRDRDAAARLEAALETLLRYQQQYQQQAATIDVVV